MPRTSPNIIITGTPGVGKTSHCELLAERTGLTHLSVNDVVKDKACHEGYDDEFQSWIVDEDKVWPPSKNVRNATGCSYTWWGKLLDAIEPTLLPGGVILDWHACDLFPESWIDLVVVLRVETKVLYDRLKARNYPEKKLQENIDSEIMQVLLDEAREAYDEQIVVELQSGTTEELEANVERIEGWVRQWREDRGKEGEAV